MNLKNLKIQYFKEYLYNLFEEMFKGKYWGFIIKIC